jgi:hypothetical protein
MGESYARSPGRQATAHPAYTDFQVVAEADRKIRRWIESSDIAGTPGSDGQDTKLDPAPLNGQPFRLALRDRPPSRRPKD